MAFLNIFKKKKKVEEKKEEKKIEPEAAREGKIQKKERKLDSRPKTKKGDTGISYRILHSPHITEKASMLAEKNRYVFKVFPGANKIEVKKAVEGIYGVNVLGVRIIKVRPKKRRLGRQIGWTKGYKKAIVEIKEGQKIEILPR